MYHLCTLFFFVIIRLPPKSTRTDTLLPYTTLFRSLRGREKVKDFVPAGNLPTRLNPRHQSNVERQRVVEAGHEDLGIEVGGVCDDPPAVEIRVHVPNAIVCPHYPFGFDLLGVLNELLDKFSIPSFLQLVLALDRKSTRLNSSH